MQKTNQKRDRLQSPLLILSEFKQIDSSLLLVKSSKNFGVSFLITLRTWGMQFY